MIMDQDHLARRLLKQDKRALSRSISLVENQSPKSDKIISEVFPHIGKSHIIGITGPPGSGKSTLINKLIQYYRKEDLSIAVLAIDPTSPFTGGAILGDRIRMLEFSADSKVFIRSMASRGRIGGLSTATFDSLCLLDAFGFDVILIETVGAGQNEVDIYRHCDTTIVVTVPGLGDDIQSIKAGMYEIPDIFVVNKADLEGSDELQRQLKIMLEMHSSNDEWEIPVLKTSSYIESGIDRLIKKINNHFTYMQTSKHLNNRRSSRVKTEVMYKLHNLILANFEENQRPIDNEIEEYIKKNLSPSVIAKKIITSLNNK
ncbi:MAG: putative GTPase [Candidatus Heimdallarchaeota archaeon LC_2]|nr:MAG: putative GTPase [Candidatus Heimdallarchaeota archaeon LC_2]